MSFSTVIFFMGFLALIALLLSLDIGVFHKKDHVIGFKEATIWTGIWIIIALLFAIIVYTHGDWIHGIHDHETLTAYYNRYFHGSTTHYYDSALSYEANLTTFRHTLTLEYLTGYLLEKTLSIDNIFVMIMLFASFKIDRKYYHKVLFWGILGAIVLRFIFIFSASAVISRFSWVLAVFGLFLLYSGVKVFFEKEKDKTAPLKQHPVEKFCARHFRLDYDYTTPHFFKKKDGKTWITPLFMSLVVIEFTDVVFAVDSIPAIFSITQDPFIVFFSNIFAILGLRSLFFMLESVMGKFSLLKYGLGVLLTFIGIKMLLHTFTGIEISTGASLAVVFGVLVGSICLSLLKDRLPHYSKQ